MNYPPGLQTKSLSRLLLTNVAVNKRTKFSDTQKFFKIKSLAYLYLNIFVSWNDDACRLPKRHPLGFYSLILIQEEILRYIRGIVPELSMPITSDVASMTHRSQFASNFGRKLAANPIRRVVSHASRGMRLCINGDDRCTPRGTRRSRRWAIFPPCARARSRALYIRHPINVWKIGKNCLRESKLRSVTWAVWKNWSDNVRPWFI